MKNLFFILISAILFAACTNESDPVISYENDIVSRDTIMLEYTTPDLITSFDEIAVVLPSDSGKEDLYLKSSYETYQPFTPSEKQPYMVVTSYAYGKMYYEYYGIPAIVKQNTKMIYKTGGDNILPNGTEYICDIYQVAARVLAPKSGTITIDYKNAGWGLGNPNPQERYVYFQDITVNGKKFLDVMSWSHYIKSSTIGQSINKFCPIHPDDIVLAYWVN